MVSEKMYELGTKKSTIRTIFEYGRKRALEVGEENIYDFSIGNPNVPAPEFVKQAIIDILNEMDPCAVHGYTVAPGNPEVREVLAKEQVIVDEDAFEKFQYMIDRSTKIKPGTKSFKVNSSLREIVDVLSN